MEDISKVDAALAQCILCLYGVDLRVDGLEAHDAAGKATLSRFVRPVSNALLFSPNFQVKYVGTMRLLARQGSSTPHAASIVPFSSSSGIFCTCTYARAVFGEGICFSRLV